MDSRYIALAVPFFFLLMGIEWLVLRHRAARVSTPGIASAPGYRFHDSVANLGCGIGQQMIDVCTKGVVLVGYVWIFRHARVHTFRADSALAWVSIMVALDLCYYAFHRASHRVNALWALHAVHHQSEEYNLSAALRQSWFDPLVEWTFYTPLALAGFPPEMYLAAVTFNRLYQFWIHTRAVKRLGAFEWVFNTPSHHRVHHGIDPEYIDKNYGGIFIVWDRLFGTFRREAREPVYGTVKPLASWNALRANTAEWSRIAGLAAGASRVREKMAAWFAPPEWRPENLGGAVTVPAVDHAMYRKHDAPVARGLDGYVAVNLMVAVGGATMLLWWSDRAGIVALVMAATVVMLAVRNLGALLDGARASVALEWLRLAGTVALVAWLARDLAAYPAMLGSAVVVASAMAAWLARIEGSARSSARSAVKPVVAA